MTRSLRFRPKAAADLEEIWDYTARNWGLEQAERYIAGIRDACRDLTEGKRMGVPIHAIRPGYCKLRAGRHIIFYRLAEDGAVEAVRILHERMDVGGRLSET